MLVVGVGNRLRGDDAAGLEVARRVRSLVESDLVLVLEQEGEPLGLIERWEGAAAAVVVDAIDAGSPPGAGDAGGRAGAVHRMDASAAPVPAQLYGRSSTHALGLAEAIELARTLDRLPSRLVVYGIEGARFDAGGELSPQVRAVIPAVSRAVAREALELSDQA